MFKRKFSMSALFNTIFVLVIILSVVCQCQSSTYRNLVQKIFQDYDPGLRPVENYTSVVNVSLRFGVIQLLSVEEIAQSIELVCFMEMMWKDEHLTWNPDEYGNISRFRYPHDKVWKPDIILINTPDLNDGPVVNSVSTNVVISSDGSVLNSFIAVFKASCKNLDMSQFPFDKHICAMEFGSWTYSGAEVDIFDTAYVEDLPTVMKPVPSPEFELHLASVEKLHDSYCCPNETYPYLRINIKFQRKSLYYWINLFIPTIVTCYVCFFGMFTPNISSGDRVDKSFLGVCTLLAMSMLMLTVAGQLPVQSDTVSLMGIFLGMYILLIAAAVVVTTLVMEVHIRGQYGRPIPHWVRKWILVKMGKWLVVHVPDDPSCFEFEEKTKVKVTKKEKRLLLEEKDEELVNLLEKKLLPIDEMIAKILEDQRQQNYESMVSIEWRQLCLVLDRISLIFFISLSTIFTIYLLSP